MIEFRDTLTGLIDEYGQVEEDQFELPKPAVIGEKRTKQVHIRKFYGRFFIARHKLQKRTTPRISKISGKFLLHVIEKEI